MVAPVFLGAQVAEKITSLLKNGLVIFSEPHPPPEMAAHQSRAWGRFFPGSLLSCPVEAQERSEANEHVTNARSRRDSDRA